MQGEDTSGPGSKILIYVAARVFDGEHIRNKVEKSVKKQYAIFFACPCSFNEQCFKETSPSCLFVCLLSACHLTKQGHENSFSITIINTIQTLITDIC